MLRRLPPDICRQEVVAVTVLDPPLEVYSPDDFMAVLDDYEAGGATLEERVEMEAEIARRREQTLRVLRAVHGPNYVPE